MDREAPTEMKRPKTLWDHVWKALRTIHSEHTISFYLVFAVFIMLLLSTRLTYVLKDPRLLAFYLSLYFLFFFVVMYRAIVDFFEILRTHYRESNQIFQSTIGDKKFIEELGEKVSEREP